MPAAAVEAARRQFGCMPNRSSRFPNLPPPPGPPLQSLKLHAEPLTESILRIRLTDADSKRWEVPAWLFRSDLLPGGGGSGPDRKAAGSSKSGRALKAGASAGAAAGGAAGAPAHAGGSGENSQQFKMEVQEAPFSMEVTRRGGSGAPVFNTTGMRLVYKASAVEGAGARAGGPYAAAALSIVCTTRGCRRACGCRRCIVATACAAVLASPAGPIPRAQLLGCSLHPAVWRGGARLPHAAPRVSSHFQLPCFHVACLHGLHVSVVSCMAAVPCACSCPESAVPRHPHATRVQAQRHAAGAVEPRPGAHLSGAGGQAGGMAGMLLQRAGAVGQRACRRMACGVQLLMLASPVPHAPSRMEQNMYSSHPYILALEEGGWARAGARGAAAAKADALGESSDACWAQAAAPPDLLCSPPCRRLGMGHAAAQLQRHGCCAY